MRSDFKNDITIIHRYFWPQNYPYANMLKYFVEDLIDSGLSVSVYCCHEPDSDQKLQRQFWARKRGVYIRSLAVKSERNFAIWRKVLSAALYSCWVFYGALICRSRIIWVATTPPLIVVFVLRFARLFRKFKIVYHCQDIHPEALALNGNIRNPKLLRLLKYIDGVNIRTSDLVVTLSEDMRETIAQRQNFIENITVINNFISGEVSYPIKKLRKTSSCKPQLLFAGSLGRFQNLEFLIEVVINLAKDAGIRTVFVGEGPMREQMESKVIAANVGEMIKFTGQIPLLEAINKMHDADFGLISLKEGVDRVAYPSKTIMYLANGLPCIAFLNPKSSVGKMINDERLGISIRPDDVLTATEMVTDFLDQESLGIRSKADIAKFAQANFSRDVVVRKLSDLVIGLLK